MNTNFFGVYIKKLNNNVKKSFFIYNYFFFKKKELCVSHLSTQIYFIFLLANDAMSTEKKRRKTTASLPASTQLMTLEIGPIAKIVCDMLIWTIKDQQRANNKHKWIRNPFEYWPWMLSKTWYQIAKKNRIFVLFCDMHPIWHNKSLSVTRAQLIENYQAIHITNQRTNHLFAPGMPEWITKYYARIHLKDRGWDPDLVAVFPSQCPFCQIPGRRVNEIKRLVSLGSTLDEQMNKLTFAVKMFFLGPPDTPYAGGLFVATATFTPNFPLSAPIVIWRTPIFHVNIDTDRLDQTNIQSVLFTKWDPVYASVPLLAMTVACLLKGKNLESKAWPKKIKVAIDGGEETVIVTDENPPPIHSRVVYEEDKVEYENEARLWTRTHALLEPQRKFIPLCNCTNLVQNRLILLS